MSQALQASPSDTCIVPWFLDGFAMEPQAHRNNKQPEANLQPLKWENWQRVRSRSFTFVLFCQPFQKTKRTKKQETKNKNTKNKKHEKKKKKTRLHTSRGGVVAESWVLSFCVFVCFLFFLFLDVFCFFVCSVLFSHCRDAKQKLSMVAQ